MKRFEHVRQRLIRGSRFVLAGGTTSLLLSLPSCAFASAPSVTTLSAFSTGTTTAKIEGEVDPEGLTTYYRVAYSQPNSVLCRIGGTILTEQFTSLEQLGFTDATSHAVDISLSGLTQGAEYCAEMIAENSLGAARGTQQDFTAGAPKTLTFAAHATGTTTAIVEGEVNPASQATDYRVAYGLTSQFWCRVGYLGMPEHMTAVEPLDFTDSNPHSVSVGLNGLDPGTEYCAEMIAEDGSGTGHGDQVTFTTAYTTPANVAPAGTGSGTANPPPLVAAAGGLSLDGSTITVQRSGETAIKLTCTSARTCSGKLTLTAKVTILTGKHKHAKTKTIGVVTFSIPNDKKGTVELELNRIGRTLLSAARGHLDATLTMLETTPSPSHTSTKSVRLVLHKVKKVKK